MAVPALAVLSALATLACAQDAPAIVAPAVLAAASSNAPAVAAPDARPATVPDALPAAPEALPANRITGIQTNREMIAAEAPTEIVIVGAADAHCGFAVDFGDGTKSGHVVSASSPFPLRLTHTYPKTDDVVVRVSGADEGTVPPCVGAVEAAVHVSPAGSKIEYVTLTTGCPEGWLLKGAVNADKSFRCAPIPDASAQTNLIHCIDGMKYFAKDGHVGCRHPQLAATEQVPKTRTPMMKGKMPMAKGKGPRMARESVAQAKTPTSPKTRGNAPARAPVKSPVPLQFKSVEAPN